MRRNYHRKLSASIYHHAKNLGIIGILGSINGASIRGRVRLMLKLDEILGPSMTFEVILIKIKYFCIHNISIHIFFFIKVDS